MKNTAVKKKSGLVYLLALLPVLSVGVYLLLMAFGQTEDFAILGILAFAAAVLIWGFAGALFAKAGVSFGKSALIANALPILSTVVYTVIYVIAKFSDSEALVNAAEIVGGLGTGVLGFFGTMLYVIIPLALFEVYVNLVFCVLVFAVGYAIGASGRTKKKQLRN